VVPLALAVASWRLLDRAAVKRAYLWLGALSLILALGTTLHLGADRVYLSVPDGVADLFNRAMYVLTGRLALNKASYYALVRPGAIPVPLPGLLVYLFLPFASGMRVWARFGLVTITAVAVMAGIGADKCVALMAAREGGAPGSRRGRLYLLLALVVLVDFAVLPYAFGYSTVKPQPVDVWLAEQGGSGAVIQYPLDRSWFGEQLYRSTTHGKPIAYGYGTFLPKAFREADGVLRGFPSVESLALLRSWEVRYALVGSEWYGDEWPEMKRRLEGCEGLHHLVTVADEPVYFGDRLLMDVPPSSLVPATELIAGRTQKAYLVDRIHVYEIVD